MNNHDGKSNDGKRKLPDGEKREKQRARKSTGGAPPRKMLGPKARKYWYEKADGIVKEEGAQTFPSRSDAQQQVAPEMKEASAQTDFNSRFYIERSDRIARGEKSPYANSESE